VVVSRKGFTVFFTGLSGAGKSTTATVLMKRLEETGRRVTMLDGDVVRKHLSRELGFSREHRDLNIHRIGFVAAEVTKHGGACICANIAPYNAARNEARAMVQEQGTFVLVHVSTPLAVCEARDSKGLYARARAGIVSAFTGVSDPYETPANAEISIDTSTMSPSDAAEQIVRFLKEKGCL
jgi:sulfate adenylyltransferase